MYRYLKYGDYVICELEANINLDLPEGWEVEVSDTKMELSPLNGLTFVSLPRPR